VPVFATKAEAREYDAECRHSEHERRAAGRPFRDFESTVFVVPKKDGKFRLCTDYRPLNNFQVKVPFKMDTLQTVAESIQPNDFGMLVDLTDCYLTLGLHPSQRKYCRFRHPANGRRLQWRTISFGSDQARTRYGNRHGPSPVPGFMWDTTSMTTSVPRARLWETQRTARRLVQHGQRPIFTRDLARIVGKITAMTRGIRGARRNLLYVQQQLSSAVRQDGFEGRTCLTPQAIEALRWWGGDEPWNRNGAPIVPESRRL
jgi:hypothetical protein